MEEKEDHKCDSKENSIGVHITLTIKGTTHTLSIDEAREVYNSLGILLGNSLFSPNGPNILRDPPNGTEPYPIGPSDYPWKFACESRNDDVTGGNFNVKRN
jgi:hypothetical protein